MAFGTGPMVLFPSAFVTGVWGRCDCLLADSRRRAAPKRRNVLGRESVGVTQLEGDLNGCGRNDGGAADEWDPQIAFVARSGHASEDARSLCGRSAAQSARAVRVLGTRTHSPPPRGSFVATLGKRAQSCSRPLLCFCYRSLGKVRLPPCRFTQTAAPKRRNVLGRESVGVTHLEGARNGFGRSDGDVAYVRPLKARVPPTFLKIVRIRDFLRLPRRSSRKTIAVLFTLASVTGVWGGCDCVFADFGWSASPKRRNVSVPISQW